MVEEKADDDAILIFGAAIDENAKDSISITVIATGFEDAGRKLSPASRKEEAPASSEIITEEGLTAREVTLGELFEEAGEAPEAEEEDSIFGIPKFLKK